jgi:radical SAM superfamily enzyme YgiQ (UPF0313 family)
MHTALRLGVEVAKQVRAANWDAHICFYDQYAWLNASFLLQGRNGDGPLADSVCAGEYEATLCALVDALDRGAPAASVPGVATRERGAKPALTRLSFPVPDRRELPSLQQYAHYVADGVAVPAGYAETTRGCLHMCRHCPVVPVYGGRFFVVPVETVMADVRQQVAAGARHITFGDPDFLNGPGHARAVTAALHDAFPDVTFDFTTKVEHVLEQRDLMPLLQQRGARFVVSAFEATSPLVLQRLQKGHTVAGMDEALAIVREAGLCIQPTWVPFTPWTTLEDYLTMLRWIRERDLIPHVPIVQLSIRLLVPPQSALLAEADTATWLGPLDAERFTYRWVHPDPRMDRLQQQVAALAEMGGGDGYHLFAEVERLAYAAADREVPPWTPPQMPDQPPPRLTEDWFC